MAREEARIGALDATSGNFLHHDGPAGTVVFFVALPLCLGIALSSGAPLFAGIIAGIVGGVVVSVLSGSQLSVSGPAAALAAIVFSSIQRIGSYEGFLVAVVVSGILQIVFGALKLGIFADYVPSSVIKGMLAGIGVLIILKQIPHALGRGADMSNHSFATAGGTTLSNAADALTNVSAGAVIVFSVSLALMLVWDKLVRKSPVFQFVPGPLAAVAVGIALNRVLGAVAPSLQLVSPEQLLNLPAPASTGDFFRQFKLPAFSFIANEAVWVAAATLAVVGSVETLLSLEAADRLDPYKRMSAPNRELRAQGIGNIVSGLIGGLPVTSVVVRTAANIDAGARTWMSSFIHGVLLLLSVILLPGVLRLTPVASLAAILVVVGSRLTRPSVYRSVYSLGWDQFVPFVTTVVAIVLTDLLTGVLVGCVCGLLFVARTNHHEAITVVHQDSDYLFRFTKDASFINKNELRNKLRTLPNGAHVIIDGTRALFIDHDIMEIVKDFRQLAPYKGIHVELKHWES